MHGTISRAGLTVCATAVFTLGLHVLTTADELGPIDAAIIQAALASTVVDAISPEEQWVLVDHTLTVCEGASFACITPEAMETPRTARMTDPMALPPLRLAQAPMVSQSDIQAVLRQRDRGTAWDGFRAHFSHARGYIAVSAPLYDGNGATVYVVLGCGEMCGAGWVVHVERRGRAWRAREVRMAWIS